MEQKKTTTSKGLGLCSLLTIVLVAAKAFGFARYSWLVALLPTIISLSIVAVILIICGIVMLVCYIHDLQSR